MAHSRVGGLLLPRVGMGSPKGFHLQTSASPPGWAGAGEGAEAGWGVRSNGRRWLDHTNANKKKKDMTILLS